ncbi:CPBP family intramembrane glutamic endopeptidase [Cryobacterium lactosi]|uniref:CPBP family intramembrane glutamic endopeptidase n=1 Tax=Cryobacterium lactosi TaxID=1259202 RepID=UPI00141AAD38|nr:type II CAAX endopeptidase family protein [Cryobacterium lactosi]
MTHPTQTEAQPELPLAAHTAYHRLGRTSPRYRWWKPLLVGIVGSVLYLLALLVLFTAAVVTSLMVPDVARVFEDLGDASLNFDMSDPVTFTLVILSIIPMLPALLLATRIIGAQRIGLLSSVRGRLRWGLLLQNTLFALVVYAIGYLTMFSTSALTGGTVTLEVVQPQLPLMLLLIVLLIPVQAAAEEYVFRGYLAQTIGGWLRHPAFAILLPIPIFVLGHDYGLLGSIDVAFFAAVAGWLTWRTGGLEAAIALHIVNNATIFGLGTIGLVDPNATDAALPDLIYSALMTAAFVLLVERSRRRELAE